MAPHDAAHAAAAGRADAGATAPAPAPGDAGRFSRIDEARLRRGHGVKWGAAAPGVLPAWVADMDFGIPDPVRSALAAALADADFGYPHWPDGDPLIGAFERRMLRHGWQPAPGATRVFTDLIQVLQVMIEHATEPGDGIAVQVPNYPPFLAAIQRSGRRIVPIGNRIDAGRVRFDDEGLAPRLREAGCRMLVIVNPHNPTGRVLEPEELRRLAAVAEELDLVVLSDEIHAELVHAPHRHVPFAALSPEAAARTITATSATKAYNIAGLRCAVAHIGPERVRRRLDDRPLDYFGQPATLGRIATVAAWNEGDAWLAGLRPRLAANRDLIAGWAADSPHGIGHLPPDGGYLAWLDFGGTAVEAAPAAMLLERGSVLLSDGAEFAQHTAVDTRRFARLNFATSEEVLRQILDRIDGALS